MEFEKEPTDDQLDELLRDVVIPSDLKSRLKQISSETELDGADAGPTIARLESNNKSNTSWMVFVLAASLIGIGLFVAYQFWASVEDGGVQNQKIANIDVPIIEKTNESTESIEFENSLAKFLEQQGELEATIHAIEVAQMKAQLAQLEQSAAIQLDQREVESMIAAMSEEYSIPLGVPEKQVESKMALVVERYPGTRGAEIAHEYLKQDND